MCDGKGLLVLATIGLSLEATLLSANSRWPQRAGNRQESAHCSRNDNYSHGPDAAASAVCSNTRRPHLTPRFPPPAASRQERPVTTATATALPRCTHDTVSLKVTACLRLPRPACEAAMRVRGAAHLSWTFRLFALAPLPALWCDFEARRSPPSILSRGYVINTIATPACAQPRTNRQQSRPGSPWQSWASARFVARRTELRHMLRPRSASVTV